MHKLLLFTLFLFHKKFNFVLFHQAYAYHTHSEAFSRILQGYLTHFHQNRLASLGKLIIGHQVWEKGTKCARNFTKNVALKVLQIKNAGF